MQVYQPPKRPHSRCGSRAEMLPPRRDPLSMTTGAEGTRKHPGLGCEGEDQGVWVGWKISAFSFTPCLGYLLRSAPLEVISRAKVMRNSFFSYFFHCPGNKIPRDRKAKTLSTALNTLKPLSPSKAFKNFYELTLAKVENV